MDSREKAERAAKIKSYGASTVAQGRNLARLVRDEQAERKAWDDLRNPPPTIQTVNERQAAQLSRGADVWADETDDDDEDG